jgi:hypothetical protein
LQFQVLWHLDMHELTGDVHVMLPAEDWWKLLTNFSWTITHHCPIEGPLKETRLTSERHVDCRGWAPDRADAWDV